VESEQACYLPLSPDGSPVIGAVPGVQGAYIAAGHSCWGILNGPATGLAMAELIVEGRSKSVDIGAFSPSRFSGGRRSRR
jgi:glycine/D-amino acid oxidase-like deaminating enzyme